jgi:hypothetical protein
MRDFKGKIRIAMKIKLLTAIFAITLLSNATSTYAYEDKSLDVLTDVTIVRPVCFIATAACAAVWLVTLPIQGVSKSVKSTAHTMLVIPARATFTRPVGDYASLNED